MVAIIARAIAGRSAAVRVKPVVLHALAFDALVPTAASSTAVAATHGSTGQGCAVKDVVFSLIKRAGCQPSLVRRNCSNSGDVEIVQQLLDARETRQQVRWVGTR